MLRSLAVRNFAIIDRLDVEFGPGMNVLTGETGAGKSIIMLALNLILGGRASADMIRSGAERASVDAVFDIGGSPDLLKLLSDMGYSAEEDQLLLARDISVAGKSACRISGRPATVAQLKEIGEWLVDLHGQHEHQSLMSAPRHIDILDAWGGAEIGSCRDAVSTAYVRRHEITSELELCEKGARERVQMLDLYRYQIAEIDAAGLVAGEEAGLELEYRRATNAQRLGELVESGEDAIGGGETGDAISAISIAVRMLEDASHLDDTLTPALATLRSASYELEEVRRDLGRYRNSIESDPARLALVQQRLDQLHALKRKYGESVEDVLDYAEQIRVKIELLDTSEDRGVALRCELESVERELNDACERLSDLRSRAAKSFAAAVAAELECLAMSRCRFEVSIERVPPSARGIDRLEFLIAANAGEPPRALARIASGGEISRVMLAIKSAMARQDPLPTMVFDEIGAGVGGRTAGVIAEKLSALAQSAQILCITHLAQLASRAHFHFNIAKHESGGRTTVSVTPITGDDRIAEIARMIGGLEVTDAVMSHAREMLQE